MAYLNKVFLIGNLTRDPELRTTPKGTSVCQFGIAVSRQFKDESGATREETTFVDVEAWGKQGELVSKYLSKGSLAMVEGRLRFDQWEDKQSGQKRSRLKVVLENVQFLTSRGGSGAAGAAGAPGAGFEADSAGGPPAAAAKAPAKETVDDDVPF
jgi:single-strand DNA-binding protein